MDVTGLRDYLDRLRTSLDTDFEAYRSRWMTIQEFISPRRGYFLRKNRSKPPTFTSIIDNTATLALRTLRSGMMAGVTSPARPWFKLGLPDTDLENRPAVKEWLEQVRDILLESFSNSNAYNVLHQMYGELGGYGTASMMPLFDFQDVIRGYPMPIGSYRLAQSHRGAVDILIREIPMTVHQMAGEFGVDNLSRAARKQYDAGNYSSKFTVWHNVCPNDRRDLTKGDAKNKAYMSVYFDEAQDDKNQFLRMSGFDSFVPLTPRWEVPADEVFGSGPGDEALGDVKQLQVQQKRKAQAIDKQVSPPLQAPSSMQDGVIDSVPGGVSYFDETRNSQGIRSLYDVQLRVDHLQADIQETQYRIKRAFFEDLFRMLADSDRRQITAREVEEQHEEKLLMLGPVLERLNDELLDPFIDRAYQIHQEKGLLPPPPKELDRVPLRVEYISLLAQAQKAVGTGSIERTFAFTGNMVAVYPESRHKLDANEAIERYADMMGVPSEIVRSNDEAAKLAEQERQAAAMQNAMAMANSGAQSAKVLSETDRGDGQSVLASLTGAA